MGRLFSLTYTRPKYVDSLQSRDSVTDVMDEGSVRSGGSGCSGGIPASLSFDNIMDGAACPVSLGSSRYNGSRAHGKLTGANYSP